jgi:serine/threonine-protein kinase
VIVTPEGRVKVLDFGLARTEESASSSGMVSHAPTLTSPAMHSPTVPGVILGTAAYMSPEQARGRRVDKRTDIWSFGVLLYEMLVGAGPFVGETVTDSIGAILHKDIDPAKLPASAPPALRRVISRCLERDKDKRFRDIGDVRIELEHALTEPLAESGSGGIGRGAVVLIALCTAVIGAGVAALVLLNRGASNDEGASLPVVADVLLEAPEEYPLDGWPFPRISADGRRMVFVSSVRGERRLLLRDLRERSMRVLPDTLGAFETSLSPSGDWIAFLQDGSLKRIAVDGGPPITICSPGMIRGTVWLSDDEIVLAPSRFGPLHRVDVRTGAMTPLYSMEHAETLSDRHPTRLPDGAGVLFTRAPGDYVNWSDATVCAVRLDGSAPKELVRSAGHPTYLPSGHIVYQRQNTLMAAAFDLETLEVTSPETPVMTGLFDPGGGGPMQYAISDTGTLVYFEGSGEAGTTNGDRLDIVDLSGTSSPLTTRLGPYELLSISPDGKMVAVTAATSNVESSLLIIERDRDLVRSITSGSTGGFAGVMWAPDQLHIYTSRLDGDDRGLYRIRVDGGGAPERILGFDASEEIVPWDVSSDAKWLVARLSHAGGADLVRYSLDEAGGILADSRETLVANARGFARASFSPDDAFLAYIRWSGGASLEAYVLSLDERRAVTQVSLDGATSILWSPTEDVLYLGNFQPGMQDVTRVTFTVSDSGALALARPEPLMRLAGVRYEHGFDITPDGQHFIVARDAESGTEFEPMQPRLYINWVDAIADKLPQARR